MTCVIAIDAGTTGVRAFAVDEHGRPRARSYREFPQHFPQPGWVEHDADDIWRVTLETLGRGRGRARGRGRDRRRDRHHQPARDRRGVGPAHRPAAPPGDRVAGPAHRGPLRRAARRGPRAADPPRDRARARSVLLGDEARVAARTTAASTADADLAFGTVDTWILWNLTGGPDGGVHATDPSNASRTMLYDIGARRVVGRAVPRCSTCRRVPARRSLPSSGRFGMTRARPRGRARRCR